MVKERDGASVLVRGRTWACRLALRKGRESVGVSVGVSVEERGGVSVPRRDRTWVYVSASRWGHESVVVSVEERDGVLVSGWD